METRKLTMTVLFNSGVEKVYDMDIASIKNDEKLDEIIAAFDRLIQGSYENNKNGYINFETTDKRDINIKFQSTASFELRKE